MLSLKVLSWLTSVITMSLVIQSLKNNEHRNLGRIIYPLAKRQVALEAFSKKERMAIRKNQMKYFSKVIEHFWKTFDEILMVNAVEFTELLDKYLIVLKRNELIDQKFKEFLNGAWIFFLSQHKKVIHESQIPVTFTRQQIIKIVSKRLRAFQREQQDYVQLQKWKEVDLGNIGQSLDQLRPNLDVIIKIQKGQYLSSKAHFIKHLLSALEQFLRKKKNNKQFNMVRKHSRRFFKELSFLKWLSLRESKFIGNLFQTKLTEHKQFRLAIKNLVELVNLAFKTNELRRLIADMESQGQHQSINNLEKTIQGAHGPYSIDSHKLGILISYLNDSRKEHNSSAFDLTNNLRLLFFPEFIKSARLLNACKQFANSFGIGLDSEVVPFSRFFADELEYLGIINSQEAQKMISVVSQLLKAHKERKLAKTSPEDIKKIMASFDEKSGSLWSDKIVSPYSEDFRKIFVKMDFDKDTRANQKIIKMGEQKLRDTVILHFPEEVQKAPQDIWAYVDTLTPRFMTFLHNVLQLNQNYAVMSRQYPQVFWSRSVQFQGVIPRESIELHGEVLQRVIAPHKTLKGIWHTKQVLQRYAETFKFPPSEIKYFTKYFLRILMSGYKSKRLANFHIALERYRDKKTKAIIASNSVRQGTIVNGLKLVSGANQHKFVLGQYHDLDFEVQASISKLRNILKHSESFKSQSDREIFATFAKIVEKMPHPSDAKLKLEHSLLIRASNPLKRAILRTGLVLGRYTEPVKFDSFGKYRIAQITGIFHLVRRKELEQQIQTHLWKLADKPPLFQRVASIIKASSSNISKLEHMHQMAFDFLLGRYVDQDTKLPFSKFSLETLLTDFHTLRIKTQDKICTLLQKYNDKEIDIVTAINQINFAIKQEALANRHKSDQFKLVLGRFIDTTDKLPIALSSKISTLLKATPFIKMKSRKRIISLWQKYEDKKLDATNVGNQILIALENNWKAGEKKSASSQVIIGRLQEVTDPDLLKSALIKSLLREIQILKFKSQQSLCTVLTKVTEKHSFPEPLVQTIKLALSTKRMDFTRKGFHTVLVFGRTIDSDLPVRKESSWTKSFLIVDNRLRQKVEHRIVAYFQSHKDKHEDLPKLCDQIYNWLKTQKDGFKSVKGKNVMVFGRYSHVPMNQKKPLTRINNFLREESSSRRRSTKRTNFSMQKLRERVIHKRSVTMRSIMKSWTNKHKTKRFKHKGKTVVGRIKDKGVPNPKYALAVVGCFEKHYGNIEFGSWTDLHRAMHEYLKTIRDLEPHNPEFEKIKKALLYLRPFYKRGNLDYGRFLSNFAQEVSIAVDYRFETMTILEALESLNHEKIQEEKSLQMFDYFGAFYPKALKNQMRPEIKALVARVRPGENLRPFIVQIQDQVTAKRLNQFFQIPLLSVLKLKNLINKSRHAILSDLDHLNSFFMQNHLLVLEVIGDELLSDVSFLLSLTRKLEGVGKLYFRDLFKVSEDAIIHRVDELFGSDQEVVRRLEFSLQVVRNLFTDFGQFIVVFSPVTHYRYSSDTEHRMAFCTRNSQKLEFMTSKLREKISWEKIQTANLALAMQQIAQSDGETQKTHSDIVHMRMFDHILQPKFVHTILKAYRKYFGDLVFRNYKRHFKSFFGKFIDNFRMAKILKSKLEAKALTNILGDRQFYDNHQYHTKWVFAKYVSNKLIPKPKPSLTSFEARSNSAFGGWPKQERKKTPTGQTLGRIKDHGIYRMIDSINLKKSLLQMTPGKMAKIQVADLTTRFYRLRLMYQDKNLEHFLWAHRVIGPALVLDTSNTATIFCRTFNKFLAPEIKMHQQYKTDLIAQLKTVLAAHKSKSMKRTVFKEYTRLFDQTMRYHRSTPKLVSTSRSPEETPSFKKIYHKFLQKKVMNSLSFLATKKTRRSERHRPLNGSFRRRHFKHFHDMKQARMELKRLRKIGFKTHKHNVRKSIRRSRFKNKVSGHEAKLTVKKRHNSFDTKLKHGHKISSRRRRFKAFLNELSSSLDFLSDKALIKTESVWPNSLSIKKRRHKRFDIIDKYKLQFLKQCLSPQLAHRVISNGSLKRYFLKVIDNRKDLNLKFREFVKHLYNSQTFLLPRLSRFSKRTTLKSLELLEVEKSFLKFLAAQTGPMQMNEISKLSLFRNKRIRLKGLANKLGAQSFSRKSVSQKGLTTLKKTIGSFQRTYISQTIMGKRIGNQDSIFEFKKIMNALIKRTFTGPDLGKIQMPELSTSGKRVSREFPPPFENPKIFCCDCMCHNCENDDLCSSGQGLQKCKEFQERIKNDPQFLFKATSVINIDPVVHFIINVKNDEGVYENRKTITYRSNDDNQHILNELMQASKTFDEILKNNSLL